MFPKMPSLAEWGLGDGVGDNLYTLTIKQTRMDQRFISAGGATWYSNTLNLLTKGTRIWVKVPPSGFVGVGLVTGPRQAASEFQIAEHVALEVLNGNYHRHYVEDSERMEYFVSVRWLKTVPLKEAMHEPGMFGNQNTVCRPTTPGWRRTVDRLKVLFPGFDGRAV